MATAHITLTDSGEGQFEGKIEYGETFEVESHAHQHGLLLIKYLNRITSEDGAEVSDAVLVGGAPDPKAAEPA